MNNSILQRIANYLQGLGSDTRFFLMFRGGKIRFIWNRGSIFPCLGSKDTIPGGSGVLIPMDPGHAMQVLKRDISIISISIISQPHGFGVPDEGLG